MASSPEIIADYANESVTFPLQIFGDLFGQRLRESRSPKKLAERLLKCLQHLEHLKFSKFREVFYPAALNDEAFEQLRIQSDQFAAIYPLLEGAKQRVALLMVLFRCAKSSVSANLLAKEKRVWGFLMPLFEIDFGTAILGGSLRCEGTLFGLITFLIPRVNNRTWKFAVECGFLKHLLAGIQKNQRTCNSSRTLHLIALVLSRPITQESIDTLVRGGLFTFLERLIQNSGDLLEGSPPCSKCHTTSNKDINIFSLFFHQVKKIQSIDFVTSSTGFSCFFFFSWICLRWFCLFDAEF